MSEEQSSLRLSMQMLASEMQTLSQSFKQATSNIQQTSAGVMRQIGASSHGAQGYAAAAMAPLSQPRAPYQPGFSGMPTSIQYSGGALATINGGRDSWWRNIFTSAGNNEFNKPSNWWRDTLALAGKDFVDVSSEDAKRRAKRNWGVRGQDLAHSGVSTALSFVPGVGLPLALGYEFLAKPALMEKSRRTNEYWDWYEKTGNRNIGARWSRSYDGGWTDAEQEELATRTQSAFKGSGFKKSQFDEMMSMAEQSGYFKTYEKTTVDQQVTKVKKMMSDAKYVMQSLHTTAEEAVKILGDVEKMGNKGGKVNAHSYVSQLNRASAYSGLSPMQLHEYSVGRSEFFKGMGYSSRGATEMTAQQITQYYSDLTPGKKDNIEAHLSMEDRLSAMVSNDKMVDFASMYVYDYKDGKLAYNKNKYQALAAGRVNYKDMVEGARDLYSEVEKTNPNLVNQISASGAMTYMLRKDAAANQEPVSTIENTLQRLALHNMLVESGIAKSDADFSWKDYEKLSGDQKALFTYKLSQNTGVSPAETEEYLRQALENVDVNSERRRAKAISMGFPDKPLNLPAGRARPKGTWQDYNLDYYRHQTAEVRKHKNKELPWYSEFLANAEMSSLEKYGEKHTPEQYEAEVKRVIARYATSIPLIGKPIASRIAQVYSKKGHGSYEDLTAVHPSTSPVNMLDLIDDVAGRNINMKLLPEDAQMAFAKMATEYWGASERGERQKASQIESDMLMHASYVWKDDNTGKKLMENIKSSIKKRDDGSSYVQGKDAVGFLGMKGRSEIDLKSILSQAGELKTQSADKSPGDTADVSTINEKQQTDINQTILSYMDKQVKAMDAIARRLDK